MRYGMALLLSALAILLTSPTVKGQWREDKWEVAPVGGYETSGTFVVNPSLTTVNVNRLRLNGSASFGTFIDYSFTDNTQFEFLWDRNQSSYSEQQLPNPAFVKVFNADVDQYQFGGEYMLLGRDHKIRPYIAGSLGFTHEFRSGGTPNRTDFSYSLGAGVKYYLSRHFGFRGDARWMPTYANSSLSEFCDPFFGCFLARTSNYQQRGNFIGGIIFRF